MQVNMDLKINVAYYSLCTPVPIIKQVNFSTEQLRLFVNITMVTNGGLPISAYHVRKFLSFCDLKAITMYSFLSTGHSSWLSYALCTSIGPDKLPLKL